MIQKLNNWLARRRWNKISDTGPTRGALQCHACSWEDTFWADGKNEALVQAVQRVNTHLRVNHPDLELVPEPTFE
jgi:hypothetical protein